MLSNLKAEAAENIQMNIVPSYSVPEGLQCAFDIAPDPYSDSGEASSELEAQGTQPAGASLIRAAVYAIAGVYTSPDFMAGVLYRMTRLLDKHTPMQVVRSQLLFPYGDWSASLLRQIRQVRGDLTRRKGGGHLRNSGGQRLSALLEDGHGRDIDKLLLIGHSGGGVAAVHAACEWSRLYPHLDIRIAQVGSPRAPIPDDWRDRVHYIYAVEPKRGRIKDPICLIGSWGGWERGQYGLPLWNASLHAPVKRTALPIIGGHADYFRDRDPFRDSAGQTNLERVSAVLLEHFAVPPM